ncbi:hypothetical protein FBULB1_2909 [Fusarium bulbicola]|nr:hypothetical protein FBULB1_2909 [Fusarium bulbicola]
MFIFLVSNLQLSSLHTIHHHSTPADSTPHRLNNFNMPGSGPGISYDSSPDIRQMPGVLCPRCTTTEKEVWVIPGHSCPYCGNVIRVSKNSTISTFNMVER